MTTDSLVEGPGSIVRQFFRHYGHPKRETRQDRLKELVCIFLMFATMLTFPVGLLSMLFVHI